MTEQYQNFGETTLAEDLDDNEVTVTVTAGSVFPATGNFRVVVDDEIMLVTARSTNDLTVTRGAESTTAAAHTNGADILLVLTEASLTNIIVEQAVVYDDDAPTLEAGLWYDTDADTAIPPSEAHGTAFPVSPTSGLRFYRTDIRGGMWFRYDGTRWVSEQLFTLAFPPLQSLAADFSYFGMPLPPDYDVYVVAASFTAFNITGAASWTFHVHTLPKNESAGYTSIGSTTFTGMTANDWATTRVSIGTALDMVGTADSSIRGLRLFIDETAGTATTYAGCMVEYRLIAT